jgi:4-amino-4-deoxy-L-arabinose transferase-like glycosyltransferase
MKLFQHPRIHSILLIIILVIAFIVRLYRFDNPIADWHSWRQADTSAVSQNFVQYGFNMLYPTYFDISNIQSGIDNPKGYRFVEFPLYNILQAGLYNLFGVFTIEEWGRLVSIIASTLSTFFIYQLVTKYSRKEIGLLSAFFYAFIPYNIFYGRTILPDTTMVAAILAGIYFYDKYLDLYPKKNIKLYLLFFVAVLCTASSFLLKPYALFFTLPMLYIAYKKFGVKLISRWELYVFAALSILPLAAWRQWIAQFPEGVPANLWLLNGNGIRFRPAFFRWIVYERLTKLILGYSGVLLPILGVLRIRYEKDFGFFLSFAIASLLYVVIFATGNVQHDYYQIMIMPTIAIFCGLGAYVLWSYKNIVGKLGLFVISAIMFYFGWMQVRDYFNINNRVIVEAGQKADQILPQNALVIAPYGGDTTLLYHINRKGWPAFQDSLENLMKKGASYIILVNPTSSDMADYSARFENVASSSSYTIFKLQ